MAEKIIRSHRARVIAAKKLISEDSSYKDQLISFIDREAFVEFFLLEDILRLYEKRLEKEKAQTPIGRPAILAHEANLKKFTAIINVFNAAIGVARASIDSGDYKKVWKAIHEGALMVAANSVKNLPQLRELAIELLKDLSSDTIYAEGVVHGIDEDLDDLQAHEENVRKVNGIPTMGEIEAVISAAEAAIPDAKTKSKLNTNI